MKVKNNYGNQLSELRKTLEYAEALMLFMNQHQLDQRRRTLKKQITALKRLSKAAVELAKNDISLKH